MIPFRRIRRADRVVTSFTVAHSMTLIASAYDLGPNALWFPPLIEMLIAVSIVYMALENIVVVRRCSAVGSWHSRSAWFTASDSHSRSGRRCSLRVRTC